jgi:hypothetical protein
MVNFRGSAIAWGPLPLDTVGSVISDPGSDRVKPDWSSSVRQTDQIWSVGIRHDGSTRQVNILPVNKTKIVTGSFPEFAGGTGRLSTREGALFSDAWLYLTTWEGDVGRTRYAKNELYPVVGPVRVGPLSLAFRSSIEITIQLGQTSDGREAFYKLAGGSNEWSFVSSFVRGDTVSAYIRTPGVYSVFVDTLGPRIGSPKVDFRKSYATGDRSPECAIRITDKGSGVDCERTEVYVDGNKQIARWDGNSQKMFVLVRNQNIIGVRDISVIAIDRAGNASRLDTELHIPTP